MKKILLVFSILVLAGAGCAAGTTTGPSVDGTQVGDVPAYEAPSNWGTNRSESYNFNYPPEYTADLDFDTLEIVVTVRETGEELIRVMPDDSGSPIFRKVASDVPFFDEIVGSTELK